MKNLTLFKTMFIFRKFMVLVAFVGYGSISFADEAKVNLCRASVANIVEGADIACTGVEAKNVAAVGRCVYFVRAASAAACIGVTDASVAAVVACVNYGNKALPIDCAGAK